MKNIFCTLQTFNLLEEAVHSGGICWAPKLIKKQVLCITPQLNIRYY